MGWDTLDSIPDSIPLSYIPTYFVFIYTFITFLLAYVLRLAPSCLQAILPLAWFLSSLSFTWCQNDLFEQ